METLWVSVTLLGRHSSFLVPAKVGTVRFRFKFGLFLLLQVILPAWGKIKKNFKSTSHPVIMTNVDAYVNWLLNTRFWQDINSGIGVDNIDIPFFSQNSMASSGDLNSTAIFESGSALVTEKEYIKFVFGYYNR